MASSVVEDYVKNIYSLHQGMERAARVPPGKIATAVGVVPGTATTMLKALAESGLVDYESRGGVQLTRKGESLALHVLRRHRLIETFLVRILGVSWGDVHEEAEQLEHALSDRLVDRIDDLLGHPDFDPHGDPIPSASGKLKHRRLLPLAMAATRQRVVIARIGDQDRDFLAYATANGLTPGQAVVVEQVDSLGDTLTLRIGSRRLTIGGAVAGKLLVTPER